MGKTNRADSQLSIRSMRQLRAPGSKRQREFSVEWYLLEYKQPFEIIFVKYRYRHVPLPEGALRVHTLSLSTPGHLTYTAGNRT